MATYIINQCLTNISYNVSGTTFSEGETIGFFIGEDFFCGIVGQVTTEPITPLSLYDSTFVDCCECLSSITESLNFNFKICGTEDEINIEATNFCNGYTAPTTGITYEIQFGSDVPFCATFQGLNSSGETNYFYSLGPFLFCEDCGQEPPRSANTENFVCVTCCPCDGSSGSTFSVTPPHPVWTDEYGTSVTQMNMIVIGGINGLNG